MTSEMRRARRRPLASAVTAPAAAHLRASARFPATAPILAAAIIALFALPALAGMPAAAGSEPQDAGDFFRAKGYLNAQYAYVGSSSASTDYSGVRMTGSLRLSVLSDGIALNYRSRHWFSVERPAGHILESPFENRSILQTISIETNGLLLRGLRAEAGRFSPAMDYMSVPVLDGASLAYGRGGFAIAIAEGRAVDLWNGNERSDDLVTAAQMQYRNARFRAALGFQSGSFRDIQQKEIPAGLTVLVGRRLHLEAYGGYDFEFEELARAGFSAAWHGAGRSVNLTVSQWRNPFDQLYLFDKGSGLESWGADAATPPSTYRDVRLSGSMTRGAWGFRGTAGVMGGVRSGWTASGAVTTPAFHGCRANLGAQGMNSDFIEFYSIDAAVSVQIKSVSMRIQSQTRNYRWRPGAANLHITDNYSELSAEYPLGRHLSLSASTGGFFRTLGNERFKPQAELRLIARL